MSTGSLVFMICSLGILWGGFAIFLRIALKKKQ